MAQFTTVTSKIVPLPIDNIDTDQIIPARYLKTTSKDGLGDSLFADWRYTADGTPRSDFVLHKPEYQGEQILLAGDNFGCGSSREHAPWALTAWGFKVVISTSFADIFYNNALKNGLLPVTVEPNVHRDLLDLVEEAPGAAITVDLLTQTVSLPNGKTIPFPIDAFARNCLLQGVDQLGYLLTFEDQIAAYEEAHGVR